MCQQSETMTDIGESSHSCQSVVMIESNQFYFYKFPQYSVIQSLLSALRFVKFSYFIEQQTLASLPLIHLNNTYLYNKIYIHHF